MKHKTAHDTTTIKGTGRKSPDMNKHDVFRFATVATIPFMPAIGKLLFKAELGIKYIVKWTLPGNDGCLYKQRMGTELSSHTIAQRARSSVMYFYETVTAIQFAILYDTKQHLWTRRQVKGHKINPKTTSLGKEFQRERETKLK
jgi:uncharacterized membrane protein YdbT with pleckstrin-like domain